MSRIPSRASLALAVLTATALIGCTINPATGKRELSLVSESQERAIGEQNDPQIVSQLGLYDDQEWQDYIQRVGDRMAAESERPDLDWTFRVVDDPVVNAFALPGGFIYITRGILAHFDSEAQMAAVVGHEIGHVTARHSASQITRAQLAQIGLGLGSVFAPETASQYGGIAQNLTGVLFLKFGRDDEHEADSLGLRYLKRTGYDARPMPDVFLTLKRVSDAAGGGALPSWLSTHPDPQDRSRRLTEKIQSSSIQWDGRIVERESFLRRLDGLTYGPDPRQGYFDEDVFYHPDMKFQVRFPSGWAMQNQRAAVIAGSPEKDAIVELTLSSKESASEALDAFFTPESMRRGNAWRDRIGGLTAASAYFRATSSSGDIGGIVAYIEDGGRVYQLAGYAKVDRWSAIDGTVEESIGSFAQLTDRRRLDVQPQRIDLFKPTRAMTAEEAVERYDSAVDAATLRILNQLDEGESFQPGRSYKVVVGGK